MSQKKLWLNQLLKYFIISHNYAQINFLNANREPVLDNVWLVNTQKEFAAIHITYEKQSVEIARCDQVRYEALSIFNALGKKGKILEISLDENGSYIVEDEFTYLAVYPQCSLPAEISAIFPNLNTVIYDTDNAEREMKKNNEDIKAFIVNKLNTSRKPKLGFKNFISSVSKTYLVSLAICMLVWGVLYTVSYATNIGITYLGLTFTAYFKPYIVGLNQWYRLITSGFTHLSMFHLLANMIALNPISRTVENKFGFVKTFAIMILSIVCGNLFVYFGNGNEIAVGISGGIYGLMGAMIVIFYQEGLLKVPAIRQGLINTLYLNIILNFLPNVSFLGHLGGFVAGLFLGFIFSEETDKRLRRNFIISGVILAVFMIGYVILNHNVSNVFPDLDARIILVLRKLNLNNYADRIQAILRQYY